VTSLPMLPRPSQSAPGGDDLPPGEHLFRLLVELATDVIILLDPDGRVRYANPTVERVLGYPPAEILEQSVFFLVHPDDAPRLRRALAEIAPRPTCPAARECRCRTRQGDWRILAVVGARLLDTPTGRAAAICLRDVTEQKRLEETIAAAERRAMAGQLAARVAHDLRNYLTAINGFAELLLSRLAPGDPTRPLIEEIARAGSRAAALAGHLLKLGRHPEPRIETLDLAGLVRSLSTLLRPLIGSRIALELDLAPDLAAVRGDRGQIEEVLLNLAANARDAMPAGGTLTIAARNVRVPAAGQPPAPGLGPGQYVQLVVRDTGVGMDAATRARIFEPFFTTKPPGQGTGLGLAIVRGIVSRHSGAIQVESAPGQGTIVAVYLPSDSAAPIHSTPAASRPPADTTILLVQEIPELRAWMHRTLAEAGYRVLEADTDAMVAALLRQWPDEIHLLVIEALRRERDGAAVAADLAIRYPGMRVVFTCDHELVPSGGRADDLTGAPDETRPAVLVRPFTASTFLRTVEAMLTPAPAGRA
jgi:two-component system cell cycle sensor histidine kinase/response regulator CckA